MRRAAIIVPTLALAIALVVAGCGGGGKRTIPTAKAETFLKQLDNIGSQFDAKACSGAHAKVLSLESQARALPSSVDSQVKQNLVSGLARLDSLVQRDCTKPPQTNTTTTPTVTVPTTTTPTTTVPTNTVPTNTTPTNTVPTNTTPSTTPTTPGGGGGVTVPGTGAQGTGG